MYREIITVDDHNGRCMRPAIIQSTLLEVWHILICRERVVHSGNHSLITQSVEVLNPS